MRRNLLILLFVFFAIWHAVAIWGQWSRSSNRKDGGDFASYYYAVKVAKQGKDPYRKRLLNRAAIEERARKSVNPFFYPPPFVLVTAWVDQWDLKTAYQVWFWFDELFAILCGLVLWRWWRELGDSLPVIIAASIAVLTAVPNNHMMGQANFPVLFLALLALWQDDEDNWSIAGIAMGTACMLKMSPALLVAWWLLRWRWRSALMACAFAIVLTLASTMYVAPEYQLRFYTRILPTFANGNYNGLRVPIDMFGNHSIPNVFHQVVTEGPHRLSPFAQEASRLTGAVLMVVAGGLFWWDTDDRAKLWAQPAAICVLMLLVPVYCYEHHVVWAIPAVVLLTHALIAGRLPWWTIPMFGFAVLAWAGSLAGMKPYWRDFRRDEMWLAFYAVQEVKFVALLVFGGLTAALGTTWTVTSAAEEAGNG